MHHCNVTNVKASISYTIILLRYCVDVGSYIAHLRSVNLAHQIAAAAGAHLLTLIQIHI